MPAVVAMLVVTQVPASMRVAAWSGGSFVEVRTQISNNNDPWRCVAYSSSYCESLVATAVDSLEACVFMFNRSACIFSKLNPDGRPFESLMNVILYRRRVVDTVCASA